MWQTLHVYPDIHVSPVDDLKPHELGTECWCMPTLETTESGTIIVIHNSMDKREEFEQGRKPS